MVKVSSLNVVICTYNRAERLSRVLTTSETPGHAMAATDAARSHGAIIGKAMTPLARGDKGVVLVLVNLQ